MLRRVSALPSFSYPVFYCMNIPPLAYLFPNLWKIVLFPLFVWMFSLLLGVSISPSEALPLFPIAAALFLLCEPECEVPSLSCKGSEAHPHFPPFTLPCCKVVFEDSPQQRARSLILHIIPSTCHCRPLLSSHPSGRGVASLWFGLHFPGS